LNPPDLLLALDEAHLRQGAVELEVVDLLDRALEDARRS
jgi:hypothetical protein